MEQQQQKNRRFGKSIFRLEVFNKAAAIPRLSFRILPLPYIRVPSFEFDSSSL